MLQTNNIAILDKTNRVFIVVFGLLPFRKNDPFVIVVLIVITSDLLLGRTGGVGLDVRVQETTAIAYIFEREL